MLVLILSVSASLAHIGAGQHIYIDTLQQSPPDIQRNDGYDQDSPDSVPFDLVDMLQIYLDEIDSEFNQRIASDKPAVISLKSHHRSRESHAQTQSETPKDLRTRNVEDYFRNLQSLCPLVCPYCHKVATKRLAILCTHQCNIDELGDAYKRCLVLWLDEQFPYFLSRQQGNIK